jgi:hypothetical protein
MEATDFSGLGKLSEQAVKLAEIVRDAIGGYCRPWQIRRIAAAEADAERLKAVATMQTAIEVTDLQRRAIERFVKEEAERQANMETIAKLALPLVGDTARPEAITRDWVADFFDKCRLVSDTEMQTLWAKVLAGEADRPGSISKRTISLLATLERPDAELFQAMCGFVWRLNGILVPLVHSIGNAIYKAAGLDLRSVQHLAEMGLVSMQVFAYTQEWSPPDVASYFGRHAKVKLNPKDDGRINTGNVAFTRAGLDLATLIDAKPVHGFFDFVVDAWRNNYNYDVQESVPPPAGVHAASVSPDIAVMPPKPEPPRWA